MTSEELTLVLRRLAAEFASQGPGSDVYRRHLADLDAGAVNAAIDRCVKDGLWSRPFPGDIVRRLPSGSVSFDDPVCLLCGQVAPDDDVYCESCRAVFEERWARVAARHGESA